MGTSAVRSAQVRCSGEAAGCVVVGRGPASGSTGVLLVMSDRLRVEDDFSEPMRMRFVASPAMIDHYAWHSNQRWSADRFVNLWTPVSRTPSMSNPAQTVVRRAANDAGLALLAPAAPADGSAAATGMQPPYARGAAGYNLTGGTEFWILDIQVDSQNTASEIIAGKGRWRALGGGNYAPGPGTVMLSLNGSGVLSLDYRHDSVFDSTSSFLLPCISHRYGATAVVATQIAQGVVRMWYNGYPCKANTLSSDAPAPDTNAELLLFDLGDAAHGWPAPTGGEGVATWNNRRCGVYEVSLHPERIMTSAEVLERSREYWLLYGSPFEASTDRPIRFHTGPAAPGDPYAHVQRKNGQGGAPVDGGATEIVAWFGEPYPAAFWRRWVAVGSNALEYHGRSEMKPHPYITSPRYRSAALAMLGPGAPANASVVEPVPGACKFGAEVPFRFVGGTAFLVLATPAPYNGWPRCIFSKGAHRPSQELDFGPHSVALVQTAANELLFALWDAVGGPTPAAAARVSIAELTAPVMQRFVVVVRLNEERIALDVWPTARAEDAQQHAEAAVPSGALPPDVTDYELILLTSPDRDGNATGNGWLPFSDGRIYELRLYEAAVRTDAEVAAEAASLATAWA